MSGEEFTTNSIFLGILTKYPALVATPPLHGRNFQKFKKQTVFVIHKVLHSILNRLKNEDLHPASGPLISVRSKNNTMKVVTSLNAIWNQ